MVSFIISFPKETLAKNEQIIAYIDLSRTFDEYQKTEDQDKFLEQKSREKHSKRDEMVKEIQKLNDELKLLSEKAKKEKQKVIDEKIKQLQEHGRKTRDMLRRQRDLMVREILQEIDTTIQKYAKKRGYSMVLNDRVLIYKDDKMDITDEIIKILNENYKK